MKLALIGLTWIAIASSARAEELKLNKDGEVATIDCGGKDVKLGGSRTSITLTGACAEVDIKGSQSAIRIESASKLEIWGSKNTIDVVTTGTIQLAGDDNAVNYVRPLGKRKAPEVKLWGKRNTVKKVADLPAAASPPAGDVNESPPASGGLRAEKPVLCQRNDNVLLENVLIETDGVAITTQGNCTLTVRNSKIVSTKNAAIQTMGSSQVTVENTETIGKLGAIMNAGSAMVTIKRSTLRGTFAVEGSSTVKLENSQVHGARNVGKSSIYVDGGGNTFHK
jgi:hypothetical protein